MSDITQALFEASRRLRDAAKTNFRDLPGGSVSAYLNTLPKDVRFELAKAYKTQEYLHETAGRIDERGQPKLFAERFDYGEVAKEQPKELRATITKMAEEQLSHDLTVRMGTPTADEQIKDQPITLRDTMSAAFDAHEGAQNGQ